MYSWDGLSIKCFDRVQQVSHEDPYLLFLFERLHLPPNNYSSPSTGQLLSSDFLLGSSFDRPQQDSSSNEKFSSQLQHAYLALGELSFRFTLSAVIVFVFCFGQHFFNISRCGRVFPVYVRGWSFAIERPAVHSDFDKRSISRVLPVFVAGDRLPRALFAN